jgi:hypothetical protein
MAQCLILIIDPHIDQAGGRFQQWRQRVQQPGRGAIGIHGNRQLRQRCMHLRFLLDTGFQQLHLAKMRDQPLAARCRLRRLAADHQQFAGPLLQRA